MVKTVKIEVQSRTDKNGKAKAVRRAGFVPAVLYGPGEKNINLKINKIDLDKVFAREEDSALIDLVIDGKEEIKVIIKDVQRDYLKNSVSHVDFYKVNMAEELEVNIPLHFVGESKAVKELGGTLVTNMDELAVECLPGNIVDKIDIDISAIATFDDNIRIEDLKLPAGIKPTGHPTDIIASVVETKEEVFEAPAAEAKPEEGAAAAAEGEAKPEEEAKKE